MRILHLSDLHLTGQFRTFEEVWSGPSPHLKPRSFDFVVISGDLSQRSAPEEYALLDAFLKRSVLPLLTVSEPSRVVMVPGNHDVDWAADIGTSLSLGRELDRDASFAREVQQARIEPEAASLRVAVSRSGHLDVLRIDPARYPLRFQNVQGFFDAFYRDVPRSGNFRPFQLTQQDDAEHWSAHVFPELGIAFYGFSSCHQNDRYWTGAMFSAKAVEQARIHAEQNARGCTRIAVWHHGLDSGRGRPDFLRAQDVGLLYHAGFRIGFHGHTHRHAYETFDALFGNRFFIVSTGSLGAGAEERPDAVGNQFSIAQVYPGHVDVEVFTREGVSTSYERRRERRRFLLKSDNTPRLDQLSHAVSHKRSWKVEANGITQVDVEMKGVTLRGEITLALIEQPFSGIWAQAMAETSLGRIPVERRELSGERVLFTVMGRGGAEAEPLEWLRWSYSISNCLALNGFDLQARRERPSWLEHLPPEFDGRPYTVRFPCDELTLSIHVPERVRIKSGSIEAVALQRRDERGQERWVPDPAELKRGRKEMGTHHVQFTMGSPLVDYRYVVAYAPSDAAQPFSPDVIGLLKWLLEECRDQPPSADSISGVLTQTLQVELEQILGSKLGRREYASSWMGHLWHPTRKSLMTAFGVFPNRGWAVRFDWGSGVAGHALRYAQDTSWLRGDDSRKSLIYRPNPKASPDGDYSWLVCIPILVSLKGPAIGVVGFAGTQRCGPAEEQLREHAEHSSRGDPQGDTHFLDFRNRLFTGVNSTFWQTLRSWKTMTPRRKQLVEQICTELKLPLIESAALPKD
ncbi:metallophosphoesterase family protein [Stigmatella aurantiaca]|uniref:Metallophosphoesterase n=1 Tax=Stigmatella aurantiaca (strain DW4/3-1) TaxID=378806 RepID=Q08X12_STIAD|nr:metallophosphoesterase [Stigmatella aurantiaca]ADO75976.1 Metallophosphoesterase [Stigmatella aurantiaca DW4/3-1]EAU65027.1 Ser/Thr protein phosphatase family protein [Stigmatella aurantiaca DW4/3-1]